VFVLPFQSNLWPITKISEESLGAVVWSQKNTPVSRPVAKKTPGRNVFAAGLRPVAKRAFFLRPVATRGLRPGVFFATGRNPRVIWREDNKGG